MSKRYIPRRVDANQRDIFRAWERMGAGVIDMSGCGEGFPDALIFWRGCILLAEIKDGSKSPSRRTLTDAQVEFHALAKRHGMHIPIIESVDQAIALLSKQ